MQTAEPLNRLIPQRLVCERTAMSRTTVWRRVRDGDFPRPVKIGRRTVWSERAINEWIADRHSVAQVSA